MDSWAGIVLGGTRTFHTTKSTCARLDFSIVWEQELTGGDALASSSWEIVSNTSSPIPLEIEDGGFQDGRTVVWVSGGTKGTTVEVKNTILTVFGRKDCASLRIETI